MPWASPRVLINANSAWCYRLRINISLTFLLSIALKLKIRLPRRKKRGAPSTDRMESCGHAIAWGSGTAWHGTTVCRGAVTAQGRGRGNDRNTRVPGTLVPDVCGGTGLGWIGKRKGALAWDYWCDFWILGLLLAAFFFGIDLFPLFFLLALTTIRHPYALYPSTYTQSVDPHFYFYFCLLFVNPIHKHIYPFSHTLNL